MASWLALGTALAAANAWAGGGEGGTEDELAAARSLFADAFRDEEAKRFADALDKFQRVRAVRDTAQVEYRIGSCYEGLHRPAAAYVAYRQATVLAQDELRSADVVGAALDRLHALAKRLGWLSLTLPAGAPQDVQVRVDDAVVPASGLREGIVLEPGLHVVTATATDTAPFRSSIVLSEGAHVALTISLAPLPATPPAAPREAPREAPKVEPAPPTPEERPQPHGTSATAGWVTLGGGLALVAGSAAAAIACGIEVSTLNTACPGGNCGVPMASQEARDDLARRNRAFTEESLAIALGAAGLVAGGIGAYLVLSPSRDASSGGGTAWMRVGPLIASSTAGVAFCGAFR
jgi:hypothetical protein